MVGSVRHDMNGPPTCLTAEFDPIRTRGMAAWLEAATENGGSKGVETVIL